MSTSTTETVQSPYLKSYGSAARWLLAVKRHSPSGMVYAHHVTVAGLTFHGTNRQKPYLHEEVDGMWSRLSTPGRYGYIFEFPFPEIKAFIEELPYHVFRPRYDQSTVVKQSDGTVEGKASRFEHINLLTHRYTRTTQTGEGRKGSRINRLEPYDIPMAKALVLLKFSEVKTGKHGPRGFRLPSIADIDPSLCEIPNDVVRGANLPMDLDPGDDDEW